MLSRTISQMELRLFHFTQIADVCVCVNLSVYICVSHLHASSCLFVLCVCVLSGCIFVRLLSPQRAFVLTTPPRGLSGQFRVKPAKSLAQINRRGQRQPFEGKSSGSSRTN